MGFMNRVFGKDTPVFSAERTPEGFPRTVVVNGETFAFRLATDRWVAFRSETRPEVNRTFDPVTFENFNVGERLCAMAEAGAFGEKPKR